MTTAKNKNHVALANKALPSEIYPEGHELERHIDQSTYRFSIARTKNLSTADKARVWEIFEDNMKNLYENSSWGWKPATKRKEIFHSQSRFILVHLLGKGSNAPSLVAYAIFRFDHEENMEDEMEEVLYCYEVHVSRDVQRSGLGKELFRDMEAIARKWGMKKVMLTTFTNNTQARSFYEKIGFSIDPTSPSAICEWRKNNTSASDNNTSEEEQDGEGEDEEFDYEIYSKVIQ
ncbi:hypothetical protein FRC02_008395 [Tulasnella sp. 418]|nr:hypothetical protein FRC02_008395 [Tulasnella sp. 418]